MPSAERGTDKRPPILGDVEGGKAEGGRGVVCSCCSSEDSELHKVYVMGRKKREARLSISAIVVQVE